MAPRSYLGLRNLDHDPELAMALGNLMVAWASAENALISVFSTIVGSDWRMASAAFYRIPTFESRTKVLRAMICEWKDDRYNAKALYRAILKLNLLARRRNYWVHGSWAATPSAVFTGVVTPPMPKETVVFNYRAAVNTPERRKVVTAEGVWSHIENVHKRTDEIILLTAVSLPGTFPRPSSDP